jgi:hypothetical protein
MVVSGHFQSLAQGKRPDTHWIDGWLGLKVVWMWWQREKFLSVPGIKIWASSLLPVTFMTELYLFSLFRE